MSVNKAILVGNVGNDPEVKYLDSGTAVARFSLATSESYKNRAGERVTQTEWHNIVAWRNLAELAEKYIKKGRQLFIEGRITNRTWEDKDGNKRYTSEIVALSIQLLGRKGADDSGDADRQSEESSASSDEKVNNQSEAEEPQTEDDLPF